MAGDTGVAESTAVAKKERAPLVMGERGFDFDFEGAWRFAKGLIDGGMVPKGVSSAGAVVGLIEAGKELGLAPMYALSNLTFTNGRLGIMGDAAKAIIRARGLLEPGTDFDEVYEGAESTAEWTCIVSAQRKGMKKRTERKFSIRDAIIAKLVRVEGGRIQSKTRDGWGDTGPWATYTKRMLMYRALGFLCRDLFSDALGGAVFVEELRDYPPETHTSIPAPDTSPDPLLMQFEAVEVSGTTVAGKPRDNEPVIDAEVVTESEATFVPHADEVAFTKAIDKLEGDIVMAESRAALEKTMADAKPLLDSAAPTLRARITKLYEQNAANFPAAKKG